MKLTHYLYISAALAMLTACGDDIDPVYTVGEADNAIRLEAGAYEGGSKVLTRANWDTANDNARHSKHKALANNIKMRLQVSGTWTGHTPDLTIVKETTATIGAETGDDTKHNSVTFSTTSSPVEMLYWDDFGTADPANSGSGKGRETGLTIYAAAYNKANTATPGIDGTTDKSWNSFVCPSLPAVQTSGWEAVDLIISNNIKNGNDGTLKFDDWKNNTETLSNLLEFKHVMSKLTFILNAGKGFVDNKFVGEPTVQIHGFPITGKVDITTGTTSNPSGDKDSSSKPTNIDTYCENTTKTGQTKVTRSALVFPGRTLEATDHVATITADGNEYKITAAKILAAMTAAGGPGATMMSGYNYVFNVTVNKTEVSVLAAVAEWVDVVATEDTPKIDVTTAYGETGDSFSQSFSFYYSANKDYINASSDYYGTLESSESTLYGPDRIYNGSAKKFTTELFWPNHSIKYFFRGVWPQTTTNVAEVLKNDTETSTTTTKPSVSVFTVDGSTHEGIYVRDMAYKEGSFPSDLLLGIPHVENPTTSGPFDEPEDGISATEGTITLNFTYRMAQVIVQLKSSGWDHTKDPKVLKENNIDFGTTGTDGATQAKVEIINGFDQGYILLADGSASLTHKGDYVMTPLSTSLPGEVPDYADASFSYATEANQFLVRHDAVIPQSLGQTDTDALKFKITTGSLTEESEQDVYYISIKDIKVTEGGSSKYINAWEAGKKYIYTLNITKTEVKIQATIAPWVMVFAEDDFWL